jgi:acetate kinase
MRCSPRRYRFPANEIIRIEYVLADSKMPALAGSDMRRLHEAASANADARLAIQMFWYSVRKQVAAMIAALDGVEVIVFTGSIGENDGEARAAICGGLSWIGVRLDAGRNRFANNPINDPASRCSVLVFASREDEQIAPIPGHCYHEVFPDIHGNGC